jgi:hypothetical protein
MAYANEAVIQFSVQSNDELKLKKGKVRVNMFVDSDVIEEIRKLASAEHMPYQTWINRKLRELVDGSQQGSFSKDEIARIVDERIEERVDKMVLRRS